MSNVRYETTKITHDEFLALERFALARVKATREEVARGHHSREASEELIASWNAVCAILVRYAEQLADLRSEANRR